MSPTKRFFSFDRKDVSFVVVDRLCLWSREPRAGDATVSQRMRNTKGDIGPRSLGSLELTFDEVYGAPYGGVSGGVRMYSIWGSANVQRRKNSPC